MNTRNVLVAHSCLRKVDFEERVRIAAEAGFNSVGLNAGSISNRGGEYKRLLDIGYDDDRMQRILDEHGLKIAEVEALVIGNDEQARTCRHLVERFGVDTIQTIAMFRVEGESEPLDVDAAARWLRNFAAELAPYGTKLALEFIPTTPIPDASTAQRLADAAGHPNVGTCVDFWHVMRGKGITELDAVDWSRVYNVQVNDGTLAPADSNYIYDCLYYREVPGDGEFPIDALMARVPVAAPINMEVMNRFLDSATADEQIATLKRGRERVLSNG